MFLNRCFLLHIDNLNVATNLKNYCSYVMLITFKCTPLHKKLDCNAKNEPSYLATTLLYKCWIYAIVASWFRI